MRAGDSPQTTGLGRVSGVCVREIIFSVYSSAAAAAALSLAPQLQPTHPNKFLPRQQY